MDAETSTPETTEELLAKIVLELLRMTRVGFFDFQLAILRERSAEQAMIESQRSSGKNPVGPYFSSIKKSLGW